MHSQDHEEEFVGMIVTLAEPEEKIKRYRRQIQDIKDVVRCPQCSAEVQPDAAFCGSCGTPMPKAQPVNTDDLVQCDSCDAMVKSGTKIEDNIAFCTECGTKL